MLGIVPLSILLAGMCLCVMCSTQRCRNKQLLRLLVSILIYEPCRTAFIFFKINGVGPRYQGYFAAVQMASGSFIHWLITRAYFKVANETREQTKQADESKLSRLKESAQRLRNMDISVCIIIIVLAGEYFTAFERRSETGLPSPNIGLETATEFNQFVLQTMFMIAWGKTLIDLYMQAKQSDSILPNNRVFLLHGVLLILYLATNVILIVFNIVSGTTCLDDIAFASCSSL